MPFYRLENDGTVINEGLSTTDHRDDVDRVTIFQLILGSLVSFDYFAIDEGGAGAGS